MFGKTQIIPALVTNGGTFNIRGDWPGLYIPMGAAGEGTQATPIFSPPAGTYVGTQTVTITSAGATTIYYTTDGSVPTIASTVYSAPITVSTNETLSALAVGAGVFNSAVGRAAYQISQMLAAWKTIEGSGTAVADSSGHNDNLTTNGTWAGAISPLTNALLYSSQHSDALTNINFDKTSPFSVVAWIKPSATQGSIIGNLDTSNDFIGWEVEIQNNPYNVLFFLIHAFAGNNYLSAFATNTLALNALHHIVVTYDGSNTVAGIKFYLDGVLSGTTSGHTTLSLTTVNTGTTRLGARKDATNAFAGDIGATYIFNRVLTQAEITELFNAVYVPGTTYYVAAGGSDSNNGTSPATAWQTMTKVNAHTFVPGDTVLFNGGDTFTGPFTATLLGTVDLPITIGSYGAGKATINGVNGNGFTLTNCQNFTINNLNISGSGWTGSGTGIVPTNTGYGVYCHCTATTGGQLQNTIITNCTIGGFYIGVWADATPVSSVGFNNFTVSNCTLSNNLTGGFIHEGHFPFAGGLVNQSTNISAIGNTVVNCPGDPNEVSEACAIVVTNCTNIYILGNYCSQIAGFGGSLAGLTVGGSNALGVSNCRNAFINGNEISLTACSTHFDGCAIDFDQDSQNCECAYNLTYNNVGPSVQWGSFSGKTTQNIKIHHNISWNDVRGNTAHGGVTEQGVFRSWGGASSGANYVFNNTVFVNSTGTLGVPSCFNVEVATTASPQVVSNNIFKVTGGIGIIWANKTNNACHLGTQTIVGNDYDASGGALLISDDNGTSYTNITTLAAWQAAGFEKLGGVTPEGTVGAANLLNVLGFSPPSNGFIANGGLPPISNFDLSTGSAAIGSGIDTSSEGVTLIGLSDWHGTTITGSPFNMGVVQKNA